MSGEVPYISSVRDRFARSSTATTNMNLTRHARQLFPLILGNSRIAFAAERSLATSRILAKQEDAIKLRENPYYKKYADKIQWLKETNPEEYRKRIEALQENPIEVTQTAENCENNIEDRVIRKKSSAAQDGLGPKRSGLDAVVKLDLLRDKTADEIAEIWKNYYKDRDAVFAIIPAFSYAILRSFTQAYPLFIYPLPRNDGYEMFLGQFSGDDCNFTSLVQYHKHGEHAPVQFVIHHYTELQDSKGIVLMSGPLIDDGLRITDAQLLAYQMQYFYSEDYYQMVKDFNDSPQTFDYNRVIESIGNSLLQKQQEIRKK